MSENETLSEAEREALAEAFDHAADANCWCSRCDAGGYAAAARIKAAAYAETTERIEALETDLRRTKALWKIDMQGERTAKRQLAALRDAIAALVESADAEDYVHAVPTFLLRAALRAKVADPEERK